MNGKRKIVLLLCAAMLPATINGCVRREAPSETERSETKQTAAAENSAESSTPEESSIQLESSTPEESGMPPESSTSEESSMPPESSTSESAEETAAPPLQTGTLTIGLSHPEFLQIPYAGDEAEYVSGAVYHGGNQSWFYNADTGEGDARLENEGCGLIAVADTLLYLSLYHEGCAALTAPSAFAGDAPLDYQAYNAYVLRLREREDLFPFSAEFGGALGTSLADGIVQYAQEQGYGIHAKWGGRVRETQDTAYLNITSAKAMLSASFTGEELEETAEKFKRKTNTILDMLDRDIPVIMAIGPFSEMNLYQYAGQDEHAGQLELVGAVGAHYFVVTGAQVDFDSMQILMSIETWGNTYVIDYLEFSEKVYKGMSYLSDILYIALR